MAKKPTDKQLFKMKNEWLEQFYEEVKPRDFYRAARGQGGTIRQWKRKENHVRIVSTTKSGFALSWEIM